MKFRQSLWACLIFCALLVTGCWSSPQVEEEVSGPSKAEIWQELEYCRKELSKEGHDIVRINYREDKDLCLIYAAKENPTMEDTEKLVHDFKAMTNGKYDHQLIYPSTIDRAFYSIVYKPM
jgi:hypothetical protein